MLLEKHLEMGMLFFSAENPSRFSAKNPSQTLTQVESIYNDLIDFSQVEKNRLTPNTTENSERICRNLKEPQKTEGTTQNL